MANERRREENQIADLRKGLDALRQENSRLKDQLAAGSAAEGEMAKLKEQLAEQNKTIATLKAELEQARSFLQTTDRKTAPGLDPARAAQLSENLKIPLADGRPSFAKDGDVVACGTEEDIDSIRKRLGMSFRVHHVTRATFDEISARSQVRV